MTGADWSMSLGGATVRGEVAVFQDRPYLRISRDVIAAAFTPAAVRRYGPRLFGIKKDGTLVPERRAHIPLMAGTPAGDQPTLREWVEKIAAIHLAGHVADLRAQVGPAAKHARS